MMMKAGLSKVVSGGQTGVDRAALDAALSIGIDTGGWVPRGRKAEDGIIPERYDSLTETLTSRYAERTEMNVRDSDGTLIISRGPLTGGSLLTEQLALSIGRPILHADLELEEVGALVRKIKTWLSDSNISTLNVAGPRASADPSIHRLSLDLLIRVLS